MGNRYTIEITGQTLAGNTTFPSANTSYSPLEQFREIGILTLENTIFPSNNNTDLNVFDVGLYGGNLTDLNVLAGEIWWASNSAVHYSNRDITGASTSQLAGIDETTQFYDQATNTLTIEIGDPNTAVTTQLDTFNKSSSFLSAPVQIIGGTVTLQFSQDFTQVVGNATFIANGFIEPGAYAWQGEFSGEFIGNFVGVAEL